MTATSCAIVTPKVSAGGITLRREPLCRLVLPERLSGEWNICGSQNVWWLESDGVKHYLRALCNVRHSALRHEGTSNPQLIIDVDPGQSERITWSEGPTSYGVRVDLSFGTIGIYAVDENAEMALQKSRLTAPSGTTLQNARKRFEGLLRDSIGTRPPMPSATPQMTDAIRYVRSYFARAELCDVDGADPFELAAQFLTSVVEEQHAVDGPAGMLPFVRLESGKLARAEWQKRVSEGTLDSLEASTARHQAIVGELCDALWRFRLEAYANSHVDVAVLTPDVAFLFEVKSATISNFGDQLRAAVGQLLEYRFRVQQAGWQSVVRLVAVVEHPAERIDLSFARGFAASVGVDLVLWRGERRFERLAECLHATLDAALSASS